jgi:excisionase family DNA binding protein
MADEKLLTPAQVADRLQIHERTVTRWLRDGYMRGFKLGASNWARNGA